MEEEKDLQKARKIENHFEAGSNCQVFQGNMYGCTFAMPGSTVNNTVAPPPELNDKVQPLGISSLNIPEEVWQRLREAEKVDEEGMPTGSNADKALLAQALREAYGLTEFAPFERAWGFEPRFLSKQMDKAKGRKTKDYRVLLSELHDIIGC